MSISCSVAHLNHEKIRVASIKYQPSGTASAAFLRGPVSLVPRPPRRRTRRQLAGSDTLDSSKDATTLGNFLFDQLIIRSRPPPVRASSASPQRKSLAATLTAVALNGGAGGGSIRALRGGQGTGASRAMPRFGGQMQKRGSEPSASTAGLGAASSKTPGVSPRTRSPAPMMHRHSDGDVTPRTSSRISSTLGKLVPAAERSSSAPSDGKAGGGGGSGRVGGRGGAIVASVLSAVRGDGESGRGDRAGRDVVATTDTDPGKDEVTTGAQEAFRVGEGAGKSAASGDGGGVVKEGQRSGQPLTLAGPTGTDTRRERARMLARDKSTFTSSSSVASSSTFFGEESGRDTDGGGGGGGDGEGRRKGERKRAKGRGRSCEATEPEKEEQPQELLTRTTLCPVLEPELQDVVFKIFDIDKSGTVTREVRHYEGWKTLRN